MDQTDKSQNKTFGHQTIATQQTNQDDYVHLWQYFSDRADMLKDRLWTMATWLFGLNSAILGFIFGSQLITFDTAGSTIRAPVFVLALALAGCVLCLYALVLIYDYGKHIRRNWDRADALKGKLPLVMEALAGKSNSDNEQEHETDTRLQRIARYLREKLPPAVKELPKIALYLGGFALGYLIVFLAIGAFALIIFVVNLVTIYRPT